MARQQAAGTCFVDELFGECPGPGDEGEAITHAGGGGWQVAKEGRGDASGRIGMDEVGAIGLRDGQSTLGRFGHGLEDRVRSDDDDGQVDQWVDGADRGHRLVTEDRAALWD